MIAIESLGLAESEVSSPYGYRIHPVTGDRKLHMGIDVPLPQGTPVHAFALGVVGRVVPPSASNLNQTATVEVIHAALPPNVLMRTRWVHLSRVDVQRGQVVSPGTVLGLSGGQPGKPGSGPSTTGPHLHLETWRRDPDGRWTSFDPMTVVPLEWTP